MVFAISWTLVAMFMSFQYHREKEFKERILAIEMKNYNLQLVEALDDGLTIKEAITEIQPPLAGIRVSVIEPDGSVSFDNNDATPFPKDNHNNRPEVIQARHIGYGKSESRYSANDDEYYFFSAVLAPGEKVVRSGAPYDNSLNELLRADRSFLWVMGGVTILMSFLAYFMTWRISGTIKRLNSFAAKAENGEPIDGEEKFSNDELGAIARHIVRIYVQRDRQHKEAMMARDDRDRLEKELTDNINHELKTPVASMLICLDLLRDHPDLPAERRNEFLQRIDTSARRLSSLLQDVSAITRMDGGAATIAKTDIDLRELIESVASDCALHTDIKIRLDLPERLHIEGNRQYLESIFRNLIDNAIAYSGASEITVAGTAAGYFSVSDNGAGIPEEHLPHIFERFYRVDKGRSRAQGGTGLGLAIVSTAVKLHQGEITVENDNGLIFRFNLGPILS